MNEIFLILPVVNLVQASLAFCHI
uniref:Uncharacterized protein n=1 Tax=Arundo donax TaxID=35708 RepID=A0A0A9A577_ARUDO